MATPPPAVADACGFTLANTVTAFATDYWLLLAARGIAGIAAGILWALLAGFAASMAPVHKRGKAIAIAMAGTPLALSIGVPIGTFVGNLIGWRLCFAMLSVMSLLLIIVLRLSAPDHGAQPYNSAYRYAASHNCPAWAASCCWCSVSYWRITCSTPIFRRFWPPQG
jgi:predicted MFS family arabinose efflux permease